MDSGSPWSWDYIVRLVQLKCVCVCVCVIVYQTGVCEREDVETTKQSVSRDRHATKGRLIRRSSVN